MAALLLLTVACGGRHRGHDPTGGVPSATSPPPALATRPATQPAKDTAPRGSTGGAPVPATAPAASCSGSRWDGYDGITRYDEIANGKTFSLLMSRSPSGWLPAEPLGMPLHQASRLELTPPIDEVIARGGLLRGDGAPVSQIWIYATGEQPRVVASTSGALSRVEYTARIECTYVPSGSFGGGD